MDGLNRIIATPKTGREIISNYGKDINYTLLDFWRWSVSDMLSNATRGRFAEYIVGIAIGLSPKSVRGEWDTYDLLMDGEIKIEVKSAAYIQSWNQRKLSRISFQIKATSSWDAETTHTQRKEPKRHADVYVFCLLTPQDQAIIDPLKLEQWNFYVLPTFRLDNYERSQSSITLNSLKKLTKPVRYSDLKDRILSKYNELAGICSREI